MMFGHGLTVVKRVSRRCRKKRSPWWLARSQEWRLPHPPLWALAPRG